MSSISGLSEGVQIPRTMAYESLCSIIAFCSFHLSNSKLRIWAKVLDIGWMVAYMMLPTSSVVDRIPFFEKGYSFFSIYYVPTARA